INAHTPPPTPSLPSTANLSTDAQTLVAKIKAIKDNGSITFAEERTQIKALIDAASDSVKTELQQLHGSFGGPGGEQHGFGGPGGHGC
uniref:Uncharacterized protein n=1 Tax=Panagrolaimus sp. JU765 TaxID=591449 RepID=A0AC34R9C1_9BILA